jgi:hypothetical protein
MIEYFPVQQVTGPKIYDRENRFHFDFNFELVTPGSNLHVRRRSLLTNNGELTTTSFIRAERGNHPQYYFLDTDDSDVPTLISLSRDSKKISFNSHTTSGEALFYSPVYVFHTPEEFHEFRMLHNELYQKLWEGGYFMDLTFNQPTMKNIQFGLGTDECRKQYVVSVDGKFYWAFTDPNNDEVFVDNIESIVVEK